MQYDSRWRSSVLWTAMLAVTALAACQQQTNQPENPPAVVQVEAATLAAYAPTVRLTGEVRARLETELSYRDGWRIT